MEAADGCSSRWLSEASVLALYIKDFKIIASSWTTQHTAAVLDSLARLVEGELTEHGCRLIELKAGGCTALIDQDSGTAHTAQLLHAAQALLKHVASSTFCGERLQICIGVHVGPVHSGTIGLRHPQQLYWGCTLKMAKALAKLAVPGCVLLTATAQHKLLSAGSFFACVDVGLHTLKGKAGVNVFVAKVGDWQAACTNLCSGKTNAIESARPAPTNKDAGPSIAPHVPATNSIPASQARGSVDRDPKSKVVPQQGYGTCENHVAPRSLVGSVDNKPASIDLQPSLSVRPSLEAAVAAGVILERISPMTDRPTQPFVRGLQMPVFQTSDACTSTNCAAAQNAIFNPTADLVRAMQAGLYAPESLASFAAIPPGQLSNKPAVADSANVAHYNRNNSRQYRQQFAMSNTYDAGNRTSHDTSSGVTLPMVSADSLCRIPWLGGTQYVGMDYQPYTQGFAGSPGLGSLDEPSSSLKTGEYAVLEQSQQTHPEPSIPLPANSNNIMQGSSSMLSASKLIGDLTSHLAALFAAAKVDDGSLPAIMTRSLSDTSSQSTMGRNILASSDVDLRSNRASPVDNLCNAIQAVHVTSIDSTTEANNRNSSQSMEVAAQRLVQSLRDFIFQQSQVGLSNGPQCSATNPGMQLIAVLEQLLASSQQQQQEEEDKEEEEQQQHSKDRSVPGASRSFLLGCTDSDCFAGSASALSMTPLAAPKVTAEQSTKNRRGSMASITFPSLAILRDSTAKFTPVSGVADADDIHDLIMRPGDGADLLNLINASIHSRPSNPAVNLTHDELRWMLDAVRSVSTSGGPPVSPLPTSMQSRFGLVSPDEAKKQATDNRAVSLEVPGTPGSSNRNADASTVREAPSRMVRAHETAGAGLHKKDSQFQGHLEAPWTIEAVPAPAAVNDAAEDMQLHDRVKGAVVMASNNAEPSWPSGAARSKSPFQKFRRSIKRVLSRGSSLTHRNSTEYDRGNTDE